METIVLLIQHDPEGGAESYRVKNCYDASNGGLQPSSSRDPVRYCHRASSSRRLSRRCGAVPPNSTRAIRARSGLTQFGIVISIQASSVGGFMS
jgi:hypothetical protein